MTTDWNEFGFNTRAVRAGQVRSDEGEHSEAIFPTSSYIFQSAAQAAARFAQKEPGNIYSRFTNPTVRTFEERLATLEGGERCMATASGMAAIFSTCLGILKAGDHIVASQSLFGSTLTLFNTILSKFNIKTTFVNLNKLDNWRAAIQPNTKLLFLETPSNPLMALADISALHEIAHAHNCLLVVDNCFCTPALQKPLTLGADIVIHSATKYLDGQGRCMGGAIIGAESLVGKDIFAILRSGGPTMSPFNAWVFLKGLETLDLRMQKHCDNAEALAQWLEKQDTVKRIHYPGLATHPQHELAKRQQKRFGGLVSFEVKGGQEAAWRVIDSTRIMSITANLGDTKTTITHPATTTHGRITPEQRQAAGISDGLIRISVGLEDIEDLQGDLLRGLS
ncbi:O-succinylhomoserine sulfhydrylase [Candidatus Thiomargarita nelsonii]|uniref:O-succinylhomoserine sulfhydrylase n=1 Tax=Candidatus Thiomargarita nelsonii TaxID=1003181 RepID=A0A0A6RYV6_9GAMM|nr:O-succinylhomoserine sulfhydrylase [Candidatus Thiomargarita nelsonii]